MRIILFLYALELGLQPFGHLVMNQTNAEREDIIAVPSLYVAMDAGVLLFDVGYITGGIVTQFWKLDEGVFFTPDQAEYHIDIGVKWRGVSVGFRHYCIHPIVPFIGGKALRVIWEDSYEQIYLRIAGENTILGRRK